MCLKDYRIKSFLSIQYVHGDLCKHLEIDSSSRSVLESIPKYLHKSPCACQILKMIYSPLGIWNVFFSKMT